MSEAGDIAVMECVWDFFERACNAVNFDYNFADTLWERKMFILNRRNGMVKYI